MAILTSADYPAIRAALQVGLNATALPDATIAYSQFLGAAEAEILRRDPSAATRTGTAATLVKAAVILLTAAYLAPAMPILASENIGAGSYSYSLRDWTTLAANLQAQAFAQLASAMGLTPALPGGFTAGVVTYADYVEESA